jgi:hypothetical protein
MLVEAIARLVSDPVSRAEYAARGREFARSQFHIDKVRRRFEQLYSTLAKKDPRKAS